MKRTTLLFLMVFVVACMGAVVGAIVAIRYMDTVAPYPSIEGRQGLVLTRNFTDSARVPGELDFLSPANNVVAGVVHIRASYGPGVFSLNPFEHYFNPQSRSSGSGVIISDDGYIVTNNHVIEDATNLEVVMNNNQRYYAKVIGTDPTTDLALLKIKARNLPFIRYGDSDKIKLGEWVLAVGNPFDLNSTVTAGIVSARARNIGILRDKNNLQVEAFIQTDAAVNPGNSGGALVNMKGELIGINTAIATATGSYSGYSFAIPVSLVKKVMDDLLEFGKVQRGLLGVQITDVDANIAEELKLNINQGVLITRVNQGSAAAESNMVAGDVITEINKQPVRSVSELQEWVARNRPGKVITVKFIRDGELREVNATLKDNEGKEEITRREILTELNGLSIAEASYKELAALKLEAGIRVTGVADGKWKTAGVKENFVIAFLDRVPVESVEDFNRMLEYKRGAILVEGYYTSGEKGIYAVEW